MNATFRYFKLCFSLTVTKLLNGVSMIIVC